MCRDPTLSSLYEAAGRGHDHDSEEEHDLHYLHDDLEEIYLPMDCGRLFRKQEAIQQR
jgi:hypothetical protein